MATNNHSNGDGNLVRNFLQIMRHNEGWEGNDDAIPAARESYSPLEVVLMIKADLATVQEIYSMYPAALSQRLIRNVCWKGGQPGVLRFLAEKLPNALAEEHPEEGGLPIHIAIRNQPGRYRASEDDILALVKLNPASLDATDPEDSTVWQMAMKCQWSPHLINSLMQLLIVERGQDNLDLSFIFSFFKHHEEWMRPAMDLDCVMGITPILTTRIQSLYLSDCVWRIEALVKCLHQTLKCNNISLLHLETELLRDGNGSVEDEENLLGDDGKLKPVVLDSLLSLVPQSGIKELQLNFDFGESSTKSDEADPFFPSLLAGFVLHMPKLKDLTVTITLALPTAIPYICNLLETSRMLQRLCIEVWKDQPDQHFQKIIDLVGRNYVLKKFSFIVSIDQVSWRLSPYRRTLLETLQTNTTLEHVELWNHGGNCNIKDVCNHIEQIAYYCLLNKCGRGIARHPHTSADQLVALLDPDREVMPEATSLQLMNAQYGLLREAPSLWSDVWCHQQNKDKKRKFRELNNLL